MNKSPVDHASKEQQALTLIHQGQLQEAETIYQELIAAGTTNHIVFGNLAAICGMQGRLDELNVLLNKALELKPDYPEGLFNLGNAQRQQGTIRAAIASYNQALRLRPGYTQARDHLRAAVHELLQGEPQDHARLEARADDLISQGALHEAELVYDYLIADGSMNPVVYGNQGAVMQMLGRYQESIPVLRKAIALRDAFEDAHYNLGTALHETGELIAASEHLRKALALNSRNEKAHNNLGNVLTDLGDINQAMHHIGSALEVRPGYAPALLNLSIAQFYAGDYGSAWKNYESRFQVTSLREITGCQLDERFRWSGGKLEPAMKLRVVAEQGLGDTFHFMRYLPLLRSRGINASLYAPQKLHGLIQNSGIEIDAGGPSDGSGGEEMPWIPLLSVPSYLGVSPASESSAHPYIKTTDELLEKWRRLLDVNPRPIIGINWQGNPDHETKNSMGRSLPLEAFAPIAAQTSATLLSLQKGFGSEQLETCSFRHRFVSCQDLVNDTWDFLETAAIMANCDLVITSDTSVAHLAGGLGRPTWLLLKTVPEWRWGLEGDTSFWYPTMRLFRQRERGNWDDVLERVAGELIRTGS